jgi:hypothetical protein
MINILIGIVGIVLLVASGFVTLPSALSVTLGLAIGYAIGRLIADGYFQIVDSRK